MKHTLMTNLHHNPLHAAPGAWPLADREAATLAASPLPRWLRVEAGCLWVTAEQAGADGDDIWLQAGDSLALPPGSTWVVEAWPRAQVAVVEAAPLLSRGAASRRLWWPSGWSWRAPSPAATLL